MGASRPIDLDHCHVARKRKKEKKDTYWEINMYYSVAAKESKRHALYQYGVLSYIYIEGNDSN